jgi:SAM-dependent methyltransferase
MHVTRRQTCRACGSRALTEVINLGEQHLQGSFYKPGVPALRRKLPMALVRCNPMADEEACGLLQAAYTVPPEMMYRTYWYKSGVNVTMRGHLRGLVADACKFVAAGAPTRVLDIGCNDGTLLNYYPETYHRWGVDPSNIAAQLAAAEVTKPGPLRIVNDFFPSPAFEVALRADGSDPGFDIITAVAMFYDLESPTTFVDAVAAWLKPEGVFIFEMSYLPAMLRQNSYDTICHEHLEYYSLAVIEHILASVGGMRVVHVEENTINGGSLRCYAVWEHNSRLPDSTVLDMRAAEFDLQLETDDPYHAFQKRAELHKHDLVALLQQLKSERKRVHVYGASTKGNTILQWCQIDTKLVEAAAERNPDKWGAVTPGTEIPIISEVASHEARPDYYLVLPWHFRTEFLEREQQTIRRGTKFIFPLPKIEIVGG